MVLTNTFAATKYATTDFSDAAKQKGDTITIPTSPILTSYDVTPAATPPALTDSVMSSRSISLSQYKGARFSLTAKEKAQIISDENYIPPMLAQAVAAILTSINAHIWSQYVDVYAVAGTAGTNPFASATDPLADLVKVMLDNKAPQLQRQLLIGTYELAAGLKLSQFIQAQLGDLTGARFAMGKLQHAMGFDIFPDQGRPNHTTSTAANYVANGVNAIGTGTVAAPVVIKTGTGAWADGDIVTINGTTYAVDGTNSTNIALVFKNQTLVAVTADADAVTKKASHSVNLAVQPGALGLAMRYLEQDLEKAGAGKAFPIVDPNTGALMMLHDLGGYHAEQYEITALYGAKIILPQLAARLMGSTTS